MDPYSAVPEIRRLRWLVRFAVLWALVIFGRLFYLQVLRHHELDRVANSQQLREREIAAPRGTITDRNGNKLAVSVPVDSLAINPRKLKEVVPACNLLARTLNLNARKLKASIEAAQAKNSGFLWVKRKLTLEESASIRLLARENEWIDVRQESRREYPHGDLAANVLGFLAIVDDEETGASGVELSLQEDLEGIPGSVRVLTDVNHRGIDELEATPPVAGSNVALTIDTRIQYVADTELRRAVKDNNCLSGTLVVLDPHNGDILAMSSVPTFDPNKPVKGRAELKNRLNRTVSVVSDPGSVAKMFTVAAALECTRLRANSPINCGNGIFSTGGVTIKDTHAYGTLSMEEVIWKSSNVGAIRVGIEVGKENLYRYLRNFGFGSVTGVNLPGESAGLLNQPSRWTPGSLYYLSFGHELGTTTLQLAQAASVFANGGYRVRPRIVRSRQREGGEKMVEPDSPRVRVLKPETAVEMRRISEGVVLPGGTGTRAKLVGYTSGGKTGTAQMFDRELRRYVPRYNSTYMGYAPLNSPSIVVVVTLDGSTLYGGIVAAPVFKQVAQAALRILGREADVPLDPQPAETLADPVPLPLIAKAEAPGGAEAVPAQADVVREIITGARIPDFQGMSKRQVVEASVQLGMPVEIVGKGLARTQNPVAGKVLAEGERIRVYFAR
jgi:cell division protein FtsI (penicillin-binding protein 3)